MSRTVIFGSRGIKYPSIVGQAVSESGFVVSEVVSGGAPGIDKLGEQWAEANKIPLVVMKARWSDLNVPGAVIRTRRDGTKYNVVAGHQRNQEMADFCARVGGQAIAIWDGVSTGTRDMIRRCLDANLKTYVKLVGGDWEVEWVESINARTRSSR
jgi:hypothetical protein